MKKLIIFFSALLAIPLLVGAAQPVFNSTQVGSSAANGYVLQTNGLNSTWVATSSLGISGGGSSLSIGSPVSGSSNYANLYVDSSGNLANSFELFNAGGSSVIDLNNTFLKDTSGIQTMLWANRQLYATDGTTKVLDWSGTNGGSSAYFFDSASGYRITGDGSGLTNIAPVSSGDLFFGNGSGTISSDSNLNWNGLTLRVSGDAVMNNLVDSSNNVAFDLGNRVLRNLGGINTIDLQSGIIKDGSNMPSIDFTARQLKDSGGSTLFDFSGNYNVFTPYSFSSNILQGNGSGLTGITQSQVNTGSGVIPVADGTYTVGLGLTQNGTITTAGGIITAVQQAF